MTNEQRTLSITGRFRDFIRQGLTDSTKSLREFTNEARKARAPVTAFNRALREAARERLRPFSTGISIAVGAVGRLRRALFSIEGAVTGAVFALTAFAGAQGLRGIIQSTDEIGKLAQSMGETAENASRLRFSFELAGLSGEKLQVIMTGLGRAQAQAFRGNRAQINAFAALGVDLRELEQLRPAETLARIARGLEGIDENLRGSVLQAIFPDNFRKLLVLLGQGEGEFRKVLAQAEEFGAVVGTQDVRAAAAFNDAFSKLKSSIESAGRAFLTGFADTAVPALEEFARAIQENRELIGQFVDSFVRGTIRGVDLVTDAVIGLIRFIEKIPGVDLIKEGETRKQIEALRRELLQVDFDEYVGGIGLTRQKQKDRLRERFDRGEDLSGGIGRLRGGLGFIGQDPERAAQLRRQIAELEASLAGGLAGMLDSVKDQVSAEVDRVSRQLVEQARSATPIGPPDDPGRRQARQPEAPTAEFGPQPQGLQGFQELFIDERKLIGLRQKILQLQAPTAEVRRELAQLAAQLQRLEVQGSDLSLVSPEKTKQALAAIDQALQRTLAQAQVGDAQGLVAFRQQLLQLQPATEEVQRQLAALGAEGQRLQFGAAFLDAKITAEQLGVALGAVDENLARVAGNLERARQRELVQFQLEILRMAPATGEVTDRVRDLQAELQRLDFRQRFADGKITADQLAASLEAVNEQVARSRREGTLGDARSAIEWQIRIAEAGVATADVRERIIELRADLQALGFVEAFESGAISSEQLQVALAGIAESTQDAKNQVSNLSSEWNILAAEAGQVTQQALSGLASVLTDVQLGLRSGGDAWEDWGRQALRTLINVANQMFIMLAVATALKALGVSPATVQALTGIGGAAPAGGNANTQSNGFGNLIGSSGRKQIEAGALRASGLRSSGSETVVIQNTWNVSTPDPESMQRWLIDQRHVIEGMQVDALRSRMTNRNAVRVAAR